jgi:hypothetical protein
MRRKEGAAISLATKADGSLAALFMEQIDLDSLLICAEVAKRYGRIGSWTIHFQKKPQTGAREDV